MYVHQRAEPAWKRPKRLITAHKPKAGTVEYIRNAKASLNLMSGLTFDARGALSMLTDLAFIHEGEGIPYEPFSYAAGNIGVGEKKWSQVILPELIQSGRIRITRRKGVSLIVLTGSAGDLGRMVPNDGDPPHDADPVPEPVRPAYVADRFYREKEPDDVEVPIDPPAQTPGADRVDAHLPPPIIPAVVEDLMRQAQKDLTHMVGAVEIAEPKGPPTVGAAEYLRLNKERTPPSDAVVPLPTAAEVLKQAGYPLAHPQGMAFWYRLEHGDTLRGWLDKGIPLNKIVERISRAHQKGQTPAAPNRLSAFDAIVMGDQSK